MPSKFVMRVTSSGGCIVETYMYPLFVSDSRLAVTRELAETEI